MIEDVIVKKDVAEEHKYCDVYGDEIMICLACNAASCMYCKKDLCENCIGYEEESPYDNRIVWCEECWEIGGEYRSKIEILEGKIEDLNEGWQCKCSEIRKQK